MQPLYVLLQTTFLLLLVFRAVAGLNPLATACSSPDVFVADGPFASNLHQLMFLLERKAPTIGFDIGSVGSSEESRVNGLALCRGDVTNATCSKCVRSASAQLQHLCPSKKDAVIWLNNCMLRYSDKEFFGEIDRDHNVVVSNNRNAMKSTEFDNEVTKLMKRLTRRAYLTPLLFATGDVEMIGRAQRLHGLAQCTKDLSGGDCKSCLEAAIGQLATTGRGNEGGRVLGGSCSLRYELYPFFDS